MVVINVAMSPDKQANEKSLSPVKPWHGTERLIKKY